MRRQAEARERQRAPEQARLADGQWQERAAAADSKRSQEQRWRPPKPDRVSAMHETRTLTNGDLHPEPSWRPRRAGPNPTMRTSGSVDSTRQSKASFSTLESNDSTTSTKQKRTLERDSPPEPALKRRRESPELADPSHESALAFMERRDKTPYGQKTKEQREKTVRESSRTD